MTKAKLAELRAWYLDPVRNLPCKVVADMRAILDALDAAMEVVGKVADSEEHGNDGTWCAFCNAQCAFGDEAQEPHAEGCAWVSARRLAEGWG